MRSGIVSYCSDWLSSIGFVYQCRCRVNCLQHFQCSSATRATVIDASCLSTRLDQVSGQVFGEVVGSGECLTASVASVRPLTRVDPQVTVHVALAAERPATEFALERPFTRVFPDVQFQVLFGPESFAAKWTQMRTARIVFGWRTTGATRWQASGARRRIGDGWPTGGG